MYTAGDEHTLSVTEHNLRRALSCVNTRKAAGPDSMSGRVLKTCANQLAPVFTTIFNLSLARSVVATCFKRSTIVPVPKNASPACLNDYRPVALTSVVMKCFEMLIKHYICASPPYHGPAAVCVPIKQIHRWCSLPGFAHHSLSPWQPEGGLCKTVVYWLQFSFQHHSPHQTCW